MSTKSPNATTSKAQQILALYDGKRTTREIAELVGCDMAYVRVVARQRKGTGMSEHDRKYRRSEGWKEINRQSARRFYVRNAPAVVAGTNAYGKTLRATGDRVAARTARRIAYRAAKIALEAAE